MTTTASLLDLDTLLAPIPGDNPAGRNLRYEPVYDELRRDRRAAEDMSQPRGAEDEALGFHTDRGLGPDDLRERVQSRITDVLAKQSKDLQLAVWLLDVQAQANGFAGAAIGIRLVRELLERYWDNLYPLPDEEDEVPLGARAAAVEWIGSKDALARVLKGVPLNDSGDHAWPLYEYEYVDEAARNTSKKDTVVSNKTALMESGLSKDGFRRAMSETSLEYLEDSMAGLTSCEEELALLEVVTDARLIARRKKADGSERIERLVGFGDVKEVLAECKRLIGPVLVPKRKEAAARAAEAEEPVPDEIALTADSQLDEPPADGTTGASDTRPIRRGAAAPLTTRDDALAQLRAAADYLLTESTSDPMPYLVDRALAFAELFAEGALDASVPLPSPPTAVRARLKVLASEGQWEELLRAAEAFLRSTPKQAWLDLQRYVITALEQLGGSHGQTALALTPPLRTLLALMPGLVDAEFEDGTPVANQETHRWLREADIVETPAVLTVLRPAQAAPSGDPRPESSDPMPPAQPNIVEQAHAMIADRRMGDALALLQRHVSAATSGRDRFLRRLDLADVCLDAGNASLAFPILDDLASIIERGRIEEWEEKALVVRAWHSLVRCCRRLDAHPDVQAREKDIFDRLCRLDPAKALSLDMDGASSPARRHKR